MRILVITQSVDRNDPILGFFHGWLRALSFPFSKVIAVGLRVGEHSLPGGVSVRSLGKEAGKSRWEQIRTFWKLQWELKDQYDAVFVHMTPVWIVLGAPMWLVLRKPMYLWYEARGGGLMLRLALLFVRKVFSASTHGMPARTKKSVVTGHGIDTDLFRPVGERDPGLVLTVGRITASKNLHVIIRAFKTLLAGPHGTDMRLRIVGEPRTDADARVLQDLKELARRESVASRVSIGPVSQADLLPLVQRCGLFLHASKTALDKALLEAMACGCLVISSAQASDLLPISCLSSEESMADAAARLLALPGGEQEALRRELRQRVVEKHGLSGLVKRLAGEMRGCLHP